MSRTTCQISGCGSRVNEIKLFHFPSNIQKCQLWLNAINCPILSSYPIDGLWHREICAKHFTASSFASSEQTKLNSNAVPSLDSVISDKTMTKSTFISHPTNLNNKVVPALELAQPSNIFHPLDSPILDCVTPSSFKRDSTNNKSLRFNKNPAAGGVISHELRENNNALAKKLQHWKTNYNMVLAERNQLQMVNINIMKRNKNLKNRLKEVVIWAKGLLQCIVKGSEFASKIICHADVEQLMNLTMDLTQLSADTIVNTTNNNAPDLQGGSSPSPSVNDNNSEGEKEEGELDDDYELGEDDDADELREKDDDDDSKEEDKENLSDVNQQNNIDKRLNTLIEEDTISDMTSSTTSEETPIPSMILNEVRVVLTPCEFDKYGCLKRKSSVTPAMMSPQTVTKRRRRRNIECVMYAETSPPDSPVSSSSNKSSIANNPTPNLSTVIDNLSDHFNPEQEPSTNGEHSPRKSARNNSRLTMPTKNRSFSRGSRSPNLKSPDSTPSTPGGGEKKKLPMNKVQVGSAPSPNLKVVKSKIGSLSNANYKPGGGHVKIKTKKIDVSSAHSKIGAKNETYAPSGGDKKIISQKLQWNAKSKIGSLENATHKPKGGDKKIETVKLDFKEKAKPKVGSKDNMKYTPGGGDIKIETKKLNIKSESKVGSLDNLKHKPGGGDKKIFDDKEL